MKQKVLLHQDAGLAERNPFFAESTGQAFKTIFGVKTPALESLTNFYRYDTVDLFGFPLRHLFF